ncbi:MAG: GtrA family protein [Candidatus Heimdallarchaeaceae archaeon]
MNHVETKYFNKARGIRFAKFLVIGIVGWGLNELFIFLSILILDQFFVSDLLFNIWYFEIKKIQIASLCSIILVTAFSFNMHKSWTFKGLEKRTDVKASTQFFQFLLIGLSAAVLYIGIIYVLHNILDWNEFFSTTIGFFVGILNNFVWNDLWTFNPKSGKKKIDAESDVSKEEQLDFSATTPD